jgi:hypothetical protein
MPASELLKEHAIHRRFPPAAPFSSPFSLFSAPSLLFLMLEPAQARAVRAGQREARQSAAIVCCCARYAREERRCLALRCRRCPRRAMMMICRAAHATRKQRRDDAGCAMARKKMQNGERSVSALWRRL